MPFDAATNVITPTALTLSANDWARIDRVLRSALDEYCSREDAIAQVRADFHDVFGWARPEVPAFLIALQEGRIDGSCYEGKCACLVGTIAKVRGVWFETLPNDATRPAEEFIYPIEEGDTPATNPIAALVEQWTVEWLHDNAGAAA